MTDSPWQVRVSQGSVSTPEELSASHREIIDYQLCGRADTNHTFRDVRSAAIARRRDRSDREKYYHYRGVNRGQLSRLHFRYDPIGHNPKYGPIAVIRSVLPDCIVEPMSKQQLYQEAQQYPRPPTYHRSRKHFDDSCSTLTWEKRKVERKHSRSWIAREIVEARDNDSHCPVDIDEVFQSGGKRRAEISNQQKGSNDNSCFDHTGADTMRHSDEANIDPGLPYVEAMSLMDEESFNPRGVKLRSQSLDESSAFLLSLRGRSEIRLPQISDEDGDDFIWVRPPDESEENEWEIISYCSEP